MGRMNGERLFTFLTLVAESSHQMDNCVIRYNLPDQFTVCNDILVRVVSDCSQRELHIFLFTMILLQYQWTNTTKEIAI